MKGIDWWTEYGDEAQKIFGFPEEFIPPISISFHGPIDERWWEVRVYEYHPNDEHYFDKKGPNWWYHYGCRIRELFNLSDRCIWVKVVIWPFETVKVTTEFQLERG